MSKTFKALKTTIIALLAAGSSFSSLPASAQSLSRTGTISTLWVSSSENYGFRLKLTNAGSDALSDCSVDFAYMNGSYSNYNVYVSVLMSDYYAARPVTLSLYKDTNGFCQIIEVVG